MYHIKGVSGRVHKMPLFLSGMTGRQLVQIARMSEQGQLGVIIERLERLAEEGFTQADIDDIYDLPGPEFIDAMHGWGGHRDPDTHGGATLGESVSSSPSSTSTEPLSSTTGEFASASASTPSGQVSPGESPTDSWAS